VHLSAAAKLRLSDSDLKLVRPYAFAYDRAGGGGHNGCDGAVPPQWRGYQPIEPRGGFDWRSALRRLLAPLAGIGAFLAKFGVALLKFKFLFSMFVSAAFYVWLGGWWFGIGLIALLFVHEMGHVLEAKRQGLPVSVPLLIPFMGALITMKQMPHNA
jgi:hypothetical protein